MKEMEEVKEATDTALRSAEIAEEAHCIVDAELRKWICLQKSLQWPPTITGMLTAFFIKSHSIHHRQCSSVGP